MTLSKEKLAELIKDQHVKTYDERDELLVKIAELNAEKRALEQQLDELQMSGHGQVEESAEGLRDTIARLLLKILTT